LTSKKQEAKKFAIKELPAAHGDNFTNLFRNLKIVQTREHLVPLYAAYHRKSCYSLILPWADGGSLNDLWTKEPRLLMQKVSVDKHEATDAYRTRKVITWLAGQLAGLTGQFGLGFLHDTQFWEPFHPLLPVQENAERYGIHGHITPHNILYFEQHQNGDKGNLGLFKISDFGHSSRGFSPAYRAPEHGRPMAYPSSKYDIWGLGRVFLELLTWLINGPQGIRQFKQDRLNESDEIGYSKKVKFFKSLPNDAAGHKSSVQSVSEGTSRNYSYLI
jgi:serine/threonine protein kinase